MNLDIIQNVSAVSCMGSSIYKVISEDGVTCFVPIDIMNKDYVVAQEWLSENS